VPLFVWGITFDLFGLGDSASSYATAGLTFPECLLFISSVDFNSSS
jgi:hypothetical protein